MNTELTLTEIARIIKEGTCLMGKISVEGDLRLNKSLPVFLAIHGICAWWFQDSPETAYFGIEASFYETALLVADDLPRGVTLIIDPKEIP